MIPITIGLSSLPGGMGVASGVLVTSGVDVDDTASVSTDILGVAVDVQAEMAINSAKSGADF